jgi:hypothetical protein
VGGGVEAGVFDGCADKGGAGLRALGAWGDVDVLVAVDFAEVCEGGRELDAEHLAFAGGYGDGCAGRPGSHGEDEVLGGEAEAGFVGGGDGVVGFAGDVQRGVLAEVDGGGADGGEERGG